MTESHRKVRSLKINLILLTVPIEIRGSPHRAAGGSAGLGQETQAGVRETLEPWSLLGF